MWKQSTTRRPNEDKVQTVAEMYGFSTKRPALSPDADSLNLKTWFYEELNRREIVCPMKWYLAEEPPCVRDEHPVALEPLFQSATFWSVPNHRQYIELLLQPHLTEEAVRKIAQETKLQFDDTLFCQLRPGRLTGSNFGAVINAIARNSFPKTLFQRILGSKWDGNEERDRKKGLAKQLMWGKDHEEDARKATAQMYPSWNLERTGTYIHASGVLSASPDLIVQLPNDTTKGCIEIKCPYSFADKTVEEGLQWLMKKNTTQKGNLSKNQYIIMIDYLLNEEHEYCHQMQAQMLFSNSQYAYLCLWTPKNTQLFTVPKDKDWEMKNIPALLDFYYRELLPKFKTMYFK